MSDNKTEYIPYYQPYIDLSTSAKSITESLEKNLKTVVDFYENIPSQKLDFAYEKGKWTVKEILLHIIDTERIFTYRALRIARQDQTELAGYEQDDYVVTGKASNRTLESLLNEYKIVRKNSIVLFETFSDEELKTIGKASGAPISVNAIGLILTGHENHHNNVITERYL